MQPTITSDVVVAYTQCPRKAYLLLFSTDKGAPHEYVQILEEKASTNRTAYLRHLKQEKEGVCAYDAENMARGSDVLIEATLTIPGLVAYCDVLTPVQTGSPRSKPAYVPRSEERRVGKEGRSRGSRYQHKNKRRRGQRQR